MNKLQIQLLFTNLKSREIINSKDNLYYYRFKLILENLSNEEYILLYWQLNIINDQSKLFPFKGDFHKTLLATRTTLQYQDTCFSNSIWSTADLSVKFVSTKNEIQTISIAREYISHL